MRIVLPRRADHARGFAQFAGFGEEAPGQRGGGNEIGRELHGFQREDFRIVAIGMFERQRARGQQHGALAPIIGLVGGGRLPVAIEHVERAGPVAGGAAQLQHGLAGPGQRRRRLRGFLGIEVRAALPSARRCASKNRPRRPSSLVSARPAMVRKVFSAAARLPRELRGLRAQWKRQRLGRRQPLRVGRDFCAVRTSPAPIAINPREMAGIPSRAAPALPEVL